MALRDAKRLFDVSLRLQIFAEGVKAYQSREFDKVLNEVNIEFKKLLFRVDYKTLDSLTKQELRNLVKALRESQSRIFSLYLKRVLKQLEEFMQASLSLNRRAMVSDFLYLEEGKEKYIPSDEEASNFIVAAEKENDFTPIYGIGAIVLGSSSLWARIQNEPMGANGVLQLPFIKSLIAASEINFANSITKGYANNWTPVEAVEESALIARRASAQGGAVISTVMQNIASVVSASIGSALFGQYIWLSVIDNATTDICISRNLRIYTYGQGPLPPAHIRCRSHIAPYVKGDQTKETFYSWIGRQPNNIQNFALGNKNANALREGRLSSKDTRLDVRPISIEEYRNSIGDILN